MATDTVRRAEQRVLRAVLSWRRARANLSCSNGAGGPCPHLPRIETTVKALLRARRQAKRKVAK